MKEVVAYLKVLSRYLHGESVETQEKPLSG